MIIKAEGIVKEFTTSGLFGLNKNVFQAVKGVDIEISSGQTVGLVGESGSGKSTLGEIIGGLQEATKGTIYYKGQDISNMNKKEYKNYRKNIQFIFQDPQGSMNPYFTVEEVLKEPLLVLGDNLTTSEINSRVVNLLNRVGLGEEYLKRRPRELSGGQCQRAAIARALMLEPELVICDEAVSALDVSVQAQILNLMRELQDELGISYLFISHDIATVKYMSDQLVVMYRGDLVEKGPAKVLLENPQADYTKRLLKYSRLMDAAK